MILTMKIIIEAREVYIQRGETALWVTLYVIILIYDVGMTILLRYNSVYQLVLPDKPDDL